MKATNPSIALYRALKLIAAKKWAYLVAFILIFILTITICTVTGFVPNPITATSTPSNLVAEAAPAVPSVTLTTSPLITQTAQTNSAPAIGGVNVSGDLPVSITIPSIKVNATIANPQTLDVESLDQYLLKGAARYPSSATLGQQGNVILFAHSSYLPVVNNKAFKTFDGIQNLKQGDQIEVYSTSKKYVYAVQTVEKKDATSDGIALSSTGYTLTLATCDSFTKKTSRFVVTATLVGSYPLGN